MRFLFFLLSLVGSCNVASSFVPSSIHQLSRRATETTALGLGLLSMLKPVRSSVTNVKGIQSPKRYQQYNWRDFKPKGSVLQNLRWIVSGSSSYTKQSDEEVKENLASLARLLILLREYEELYGIPDSGGPQVQRNVISDVMKDLYQSGAPSWVLEPVMERVAEGLSGREGVQYLVLPRRVFIFYPNSKLVGSGTDMFKTASGFHMSRLDAMESVAVRLASFASNTQSVERLSSASFRMPRKEEFVKAERNETITMSTEADFNKENPTAPELAKQILDLASETYGLFFFLNSVKFQEAVINVTDSNYADGFWAVDDSTRELFSRLAADEASAAIRKIQTEAKELYSPLATCMFQIFSSAGASGMWFGGSVPDMCVAGLLAVVVGQIGRLQALAFEERILTEVVASFIVGLTAGLLAIKCPNQFCFGAIAVAATMNLMQGFKMVYAVIEVMSKNIVAGSSRMLEGLLFTGLISYNLKLGLDMAFRLTQGTKLPLPKDLSMFLLSSHGIPKLWYAPLLPIAAIAWSGLFRPSYVDLPLMMFHGALAFALNMSGVPSFFAAMCVTFSAGIISRFTGRGALGNTVAGLYALVPGAYMVRGMLAATTAGFLEKVMFESVTIGLGAWTGTILCSPTILGKSSGLHGLSNVRNQEKKKQKALLYF